MKSRLLIIFTLAICLLGLCVGPASAAKTVAETVKFDVAIPPQALNASNVTGPYFAASPWSRWLFVLDGGAAATGKTTTLDVLAASDTAGTGAEVVDTAIGTANVLASEMTLTLATVLADTTTTVNGLLFTAHATVTSAALRQYSIAGSDTADAAAFVSVLNSATYGTPGLVASNTLGVITLKASPLGDALVTASASLATITAATVASQVYVEITAWDLPSGKSYIAAKATTTANSVVSATLLRTAGSYEIVQKVAGSN